MARHLWIRVHRACSLPIWVALDPDDMRRVQQSDRDDYGNTFHGVSIGARERFGPLPDPASDIAGPVGRDIPASVRDWALLPNLAGHAIGSAGLDRGELRRFSDAADC